MVWPFDGLRHLTMTCIMKTKRHAIYVLQIFGLFVTINLSVESLFANFVLSRIGQCVLSEICLIQLRRHNVKASTV